MAKRFDVETVPLDPVRGVPTIIDVPTDGPVVIPGGGLLSEAIYARHDNDLLIEIPDGSRMVVSGYFDLKSPPPIASEAGAHVSADVVAALAGNDSAPLTPEIPVTAPIGRIEAAEGEVTIVRADGSRVDGEPGVLIGRGDRVETSPEGSAGFLFADEGTAAQILNDAAALKISLGNDVAMGNRAPGRVPNSFMIRRPTTRMGTVWSIRSMFYAAKQYAVAREAGSAEFNADLEVVVAAMNGEIPIRVHARRNNDVQTALRLAEEFGWKSFVIEEGTEAHRAAELLADAKVAVIAGPGYDYLRRSIASGPTLEEMRFLAAPPQICCEHLHEDAFVVEVGSFSTFPMHHQCEVDGRTTDGSGIARNEWGLPIDPNDPLHDDHHEDGLNPMLPEHELVRDVVLSIGGKDLARGLQQGRFSEGNLSTPALPALLFEAGVEMAIGGAEGHDALATEASLIHQARRAVRYGLPREEAIAAITSRPAALCGMGDRVGSVAVGYDADFVLWSGDPLEHSSRPLLVVIDGEVVVDNR